MNVAELLCGEESVLVPVKEVEAGVVLFLRDLPVAVRIEHLKDKARARHYVEFTLGNGAIAVYVKHLKAILPFLPRDHAITILIKEFEWHRANAVELHLGDKTVFVKIEQVEALVVLGLGNPTVTISIKRLKREMRSHGSVELLLAYEPITVDVKQLEACVVLCLCKLAVAVLVQQGEGGGTFSPELSPGDETVLVRVNQGEASHVFREGNFAVLVGIQHIKGKRTTVRWRGQSSGFCRCRCRCSSRGLEHSAAAAEYSGVCVGYPGKLRLLLLVPLAPRFRIVQALLLLLEQLLGRKPYFGVLNRSARIKEEQVLGFDTNHSRECHSIHHQLHPQLFVVENSADGTRRSIVPRPSLEAVDLDAVADPQSLRLFALHHLKVA